MPTSARQSVPLFAKIFGEFAAVKQADDSVRPQNARIFSEILGEFVTSQRADVGIGPYNKTGKCMRMRPSFSKNRCILLDGQRRPPLHRLFFYKTVYH